MGIKPTPTFRVSQQRNELISLCQTDCALDHFFGGIRSAIHDVLTYGTMKKRCVLCDHADACTKRVLRDLGNVLAVNQNAALFEIVEAQQQIDQRGFTRTRTTDEANLLSSLDVE